MYRDEPALPSVRDASRLSLFAAVIYVGSMAVKALFRYFVRGCLVAAPLGLTIYIVYVTLKTIDSWLPVPVPGLGLVVTLALITTIGFLTSNVIGRTLLELAERLLQRVPLVKLVYSSLKDLVSAFMGDKKSFDQPVAVRLGQATAVKLLGFVTRDALGALGMPGHVAVYFPQRTTLRAI
jgi:uncharacterized membrane protein